MQVVWTPIYPHLRSSIDLWEVVLLPLPPLPFRDTFTQILCLGFLLEEIEIDLFQFL